MKKLAAFVVALAFVLAQGLFGATWHTASAQPIDNPTMLELDLERTSPRLVTGTERTLTVTGRVTNVSDRRISDVIARLQLGQRQSTEGDLGEALAEPAPTDTPLTRFTDVADVLEPGQSASIDIRVPLDDGSFPVTEPGVYPMLVNVNGTPAYGGPARLAALSFLLPVLGVPGQGPPSAPAGRPTPVSVLWPVTSKPRVVSQPFGGPVVLADDGLATELQPGGRLDALVSAPLSRRDSPLFGSLCFAIDPGLLDTVQAMTKGYRVRTPSGQVEGKGADDARRWLDSLRRLVAGHCVIQLPYADTHLNALTKLPSSAELVSDALNGASILSVLNVQPRQDVVWPSGTLTRSALEASAGAGASTVITGPAQLRRDTEANDTVPSPTSATIGSAPVDVANTGIRALPYDSLVARALDGEASLLPDSLTPANEPDLATQNGIAAVAFRAGLGDGDSADSGEPVLVAPPHRWDVSVNELGTLLESLETLELAGYTAPAPLEDLLAAPSSGTVAPNGPAEAAGSLQELPATVLRELANVERTAADLQRAMSVDPTRQVEPEAVIQPLHNAVLRATSAAWRTRPGNGAEAATPAEPAMRQLEALRGQVTVATPPQPVSLASGSSPLPVTLSNALPVSIAVRINLENSAGLRPADLQRTKLAAGSRIGRLIPAEALRSGRFNVRVSLTTPDGTKLGSTARLELTSTEFGTVTVVLTATAAGALVLLSGRRIYRRVRASRADRS